MVVPLLTKELEDFVRDWNTHYIRPSRHAFSPGGIPEDLFDMPQRYGMHYVIQVEHAQYDELYSLNSIAGAENYIKPVDGDMWLSVYIEKSQPTPPFYPPEFEEWANCAMSDMGLSITNVSPMNCQAVYVKLLQYLVLCNFDV